MDELIKLVLQIQGAQTAEEAAEKVEKLKKKLEDLDAAQDKTAKGSKFSAQSILELSRAFQDFSSGGLLGISNNIEGLSRSLGAGAAGAGIATGLFLAVQLLTPAVKSFWSALTEGANKVPEAKDKMEALSDALARQRKRLEELKDKQALTNKELAEFNRLQESSVKLAKEVEAARKREADFQALRDKKTTTEKGTASAVQDFVGRDVDALRKEAKGGVIAEGQRTGALGALQKRLDGKLKAQAQNQRDDPHNLSGVAGLIQQQLDAIRKDMDAERARLETEADQLVDRALGGDAAGLDRLVGVLPQGRMRRGLEELTPRGRFRRNLSDVRGTLRGFARRVDQKTAAGAQKRRDAAAGGQHELFRQQLERQEAIAIRQGDAMGHARDKEIRDSVDLSRRVGRAAQAPPKAASPGGHLPLIQPGPITAEMAQQIATTQMALAANQAADLAALQALRRAGRMATTQTQRRRRPAGADGGNG